LATRITVEVQVREQARSYRKSAFMTVVLSNELPGLKSLRLPTNPSNYVGASLLANRSHAVSEDREQDRSYRKSAFMMVVLSNELPGLRSLRLPANRSPSAGASLLANRSHAVFEEHGQARSCRSNSVTRFAASAADQRWRCAPCCHESRHGAAYD
jgi:hypothetical protein